MHQKNQQINQLKAKKAERHHVLRNARDLNSVFCVSRTKNNSRFAEEMKKVSEVTARVFHNHEDAWTMRVITTLKTETLLCGVTKCSGLMRGVTIV